MTNKIAEYYSIQSGHVHLYRDCKDAIPEYLQPHLMSYQRLSRPNIDIKYQQQDEIEISRLTFIFRHVKDHQDFNADFVYDDAPLYVRRNIDMDNVAKRFLEN